MIKTDYNKLTSLHREDLIKVQEELIKVQEERLNHLNMHLDMLKMPKAKRDRLEQMIVQYLNADRALLMHTHRIEIDMYLWNSAIILAAS